MDKDHILVHLTDENGYTDIKRYNDYVRHKKNSYVKSRISKTRSPEHPTTRYYGYKRHAIRKGKPFDITIDQFKSIINTNCYYCGSDDKIGVDRVDNSLGYHIDNCVSCCKVCNIMKRTYTKDQFFLHIKSIYELHKLDNMSC